MRRSFRFATQEGAAAAASPGGASLPPSLPARPRSAAGGGRRLRGGGSPGVGGCSLAAVLPPHLGATSASSLWTPGRFRRDNVNLWLGGPGAGGGPRLSGAGWRVAAGWRVPGRCKRGGRERGFRAGVWQKFGRVSARDSLPRRVEEEPAVSLRLQPAPPAGTGAEFPRRQAPHSTDEGGGL